MQNGHSDSESDGNISLHDDSNMDVSDGQSIPDSCWRESLNTVLEKLELKWKRLWNV